MDAKSKCTDSEYKTKQPTAMSLSVGDLIRFDGKERTVLGEAWDGAAYALRAEGRTVYVAKPDVEAGAEIVKKANQPPY